MQFDQSILSEREKMFFKRLKCFEEVSADDLVKLVKDTEKKDVKRQNVIICVKYLQSKVAEHGWIIKRISSIGAGKIATYSMEEKF